MVVVDVDVVVGAAVVGGTVVGGAVVSGTVVSGTVVGGGDNAGSMVVPTAGTGSAVVGASVLGVAPMIGGSSGLVLGSSVVIGIAADVAGVEGRRPTGRSVVGGSDATIVLVERGDVVGSAAMEATPMEATVTVLLAELAVGDSVGKALEGSAMGAAA